jgi:acetyltransferase-like isoleucine patch superfamily enzyme
MLSNSEFVTLGELERLGIQCGSDVQVDPTVRFIGAEHIRLGSHVRIDAGVHITAAAPVIIGNHVHIAAAAHLFGGAGIEICDFAGVACGASLFSLSDDYSLGYLTNPTIPAKYRLLTEGKIVVGRHALVGSGTVILPGVHVGEGASIGALSLVNKNVPSFAIVHGNPARQFGTRDEQRLRSLEALLLEEEREE